MNDIDADLRKIEAAAKLSKGIASTISKFSKEADDLIQGFHNDLRRIEVVAADKRASHEIHSKPLA